MNIKKDIGARIRRIRYDLDENQKTFAKRIGVSPSSQSAYEQGDIQPSLEVLIEIAKQGNVTMDWLILGKEK